MPQPASLCFEIFLYDDALDRSSTRDRIRSTMAGPTASILFPAPISSIDQAHVRATLSQLATRIDTDDFWLDDHPFFVAFGEDYPGELDDIAEQGLPALLGWSPRGILTFAAMCNGDHDHVLLAELCIRFAEERHGLIDFGGTPPFIPALELSSPTSPRRIDTPLGLPGVLYATSYQTAAGHFATSHYSDATFLRAFLRHPSFRMVK